MDRSSISSVRQTTELMAAEYFSRLAILESAEPITAFIDGVFLDVAAGLEHVDTRGKKLKSREFGKRRCTTDEWLYEFFRATSQETDETAAHAQAEAVLDARGVK